MRSIPAQQSRVRAVCVLLFLALLMPFAGCRKKADVKHETDALELAFPGIASVPPARLDAAGRSSSGDPKACVSAAVLAIRTNDYVTAAIMLQKAIESPGASADQVMALQTTRKACVTELMNRASKGDQNAKAALMAIERAQ
jgi:hypothetical protein